MALIGHITSLMCFLFVLMGSVEDLQVADLLCCTCTAKLQHLVAKPYVIDPL